MKLCDGKYEFKIDDRGTLVCLRYGEPWRDFLGDNAVLALYRHATESRNATLSIPTVVCLCGSTRFFAAFQKANYEETMAGRIVLSVGFYPHSQDQAHGEDVGCTDEQKVALDELHKRKIDLASEILVLNVGGYIGDSTRSEIDYAKANGKRIRYLEE